MNARIIVCLLFTITLVVTETGCFCTRGLVYKSKEKTIDTFYPFTVYQATNGGSFALGGSLHYKHPEFSRTWWTNEPSVHAYLVISQNNLAVQHFETNSVLLLTNGTLLLKEIKHLSPDQIKHLNTQNKLPLNYKTITDLPNNDPRKPNEEHFGLDMKQHHPNRWVIVFLPFTVVADIATAPVQFYIYLSIPRVGC